MPSSRHVTNTGSRWCLREKGRSGTSNKEGIRENRPPRRVEKRILNFDLCDSRFASNLCGIERILISDIRYRYADIEVPKKGGEMYESKRMESSKALLRLGHIRPRRSHRGISRNLRPPICNTARTCGRHVLSVLLLPLPAVLHLRNIRLLLDSKMASLPVEMGMGLPRKILAVPRRVLLHHSRKIRQGRDHQGTVRTDDARPTTA